MKVFFLLLLSFFSFQFVFSQSRKELEERKKQLLQQIKEYNHLHSQQVKERKSVLLQIQEIDKKIQVQTELIEVSNQQIKLLNKEIEKNVLNIDELEKEISLLRKEYAQIIEESYYNRTPHRQLVFLLSSETFLQTYKRMQYIRQYSEFRIKQGEQISQKNKDLSYKNEELLKQKSEKENLLSENRKIQNQLLEEKKNREKLVASIRKKESKYAAEIKKKRAQAQAIDKEIERLIRVAIAEANAKKKVSQKTKSSSKNKKDVFELTPEGKVLASDFQSNKGNLIWPVEKGYKSKGFGMHSDPLYPQVKYNNNGVSIACPKNTDARVVFKGEVTAIIAVPGGNKAVQIRHGNFITTYYNLSQIYVNKGQLVEAKTPIGKIFTDSEGKSEMKFFLYQNTKKLNPEEWIKGL